MSSFFKKLGETAKNTASTIGAKSANLMETGKLKLAKNQHEGKIEDKITEIGQLVYTAHKEGVELEQEKLDEKFNEIAELEVQIKEIEDQIEQLKEADETPAPAAPEATEQDQAAPADEEGSETAPVPPSDSEATAPEAFETAETAEPAEVADPVDPAEAEVVAEQPAAASKFCTNCGTSLVAGAKFCSSCGQAN